MSIPPAVSHDVVIMTRAELKAREQAAYKRGVERGRFEESCDRSNSPAPGKAGHSEATESTGSASADAAVRLVNSGA